MVDHGDHYMDLKDREDYENDHEDMIAEDEESYKTEIEMEPTFREKTISVLRWIVSRPYIWYAAGMIDTLIILYAYKKFIA